MKKITVKASKEYNVLVGSGLFKETGSYISEVFRPCKLCLVSDDTVYKLYGKIVTDSLENAGYEVSAFTFAPGERSKSVDTLHELLEFMAGKELTRADGIIALGGGVTGDLAGFAASCYLRGVSYIQMPTTLLAAVDSSVGGKTGVNLSRGKNLAGAFWQPSLVLCDYSAFSSLAEGELLDGIAEIIKYGVIADSDFFKLMLANTVTNLFEKGLFEQIIEKCVTIKSRIVGEDERDTGIRQLLNFGHTLGHAIEKCSGYGISHGRAVALGMLYISRAAASAGIAADGCAAEIEQALKRYGFTLSCDYSAGELCEAALADKKRSGNSITLVVPVETGDCRLEKFDIDLFKRFVGRGFFYGHQNF